MGPDAYTGACRASYRALSALVGEGRVEGYSERYASRDLVASINFIGLDARPREVFSLALFAALASFAALIGAGMASLVFWPMDGAAAAVLMLCLGVVPLLVFVYVSEYPKRRAAYMKVRSLGDVPEVISYIVMSMKLNPNIERALRFAATNSRRQLAKDVRKLMWDLQMRAYDSLDDALDSFADGWTYGEHFKRSMFLIKSSTCEREEAMRTIALNRALDVVLKGTKGLMQAFSSSLHAPTLILYSIFVMVPLALVAMLPAAAVVGLKVNALEIALLYDVLFPLATLLYAHTILMKRPAAFTPPEIPDDHPMLSHPRYTWALLAAGCGLAAASLCLIVPDGLFPISNTIFIVWGITAAISVYCVGVYTPYKRIRDEIASMEADFSDSLFILGRRMAEGKSPEDGFAYTAGMVSGSAIGRAYAKAAFNIRCLRSTLYEAVLGEHGAFADVYSDRIRATIGMLVESSVKSGEVAGSSVVRLADHLKELQEIEDEIRKMLFTMTSMLRTTCVVFAPFIGGITLALSQSVTNVVGQTMSSLSDMPESARAYFPMVPEFGAPLVSPGAFVLIVGVYLVMLVIILLRFVDGIEHGDDRYELMYGIGRTLPLSVAVFTATTMVANVAFAGML